MGSVFATDSPGYRDFGGTKENHLDGFLPGKIANLNIFTLLHTHRRIFFSSYFCCYYFFVWYVVKGGVPGAGQRAEIKQQSGSAC